MSEQVFKTVKEFLKSVREEIRTITKIATGEEKERLDFSPTPRYKTNRTYWFINSLRK